MSDTVITVENLSKAYLLGHQERQDTLFGAVASAVKSPLRSLRELHRLNTFNLSKRDEERDDILWALRDVSFEVKRGEVLGIIGRNGAGKSTLLKILSRIADPTHGRAEIRGRVSALLEVGTGFHPELTGRENVYLNGTILGMKKAEIDSKFDEIVDFSGVERFLDTPVKRYSSGMAVRLAFAVAAHLEPEILIIDEVLAVGDTEFQKKCLGKMQDVATGEGRTVLFVSHNMGAVRNLCTKGLSLREGRLVYLGDSEECVARYVQVSSGRARSLWELDKHKKELHISRISTRLEGKQPRHILLVDLLLRSEQPHPPAFLAVDIHDQGGAWIMQAIPKISPFIRNVRGELRVTVKIELPPLIPGEYLVGAWIGSHLNQTIDSAKEATAFEIAETPTTGRTAPHSPARGYFVPVSEVVEVI